MPVRPYLLIGSTVLERIRDLGSQAVAVWSREWLSQDMLPLVTCRSIDRTGALLAPTEWRSDSKQPFWWTAGADHSVCQWLFAGTDGGGASSGSLARECAKSGLDDLLRRLARALEIDPAVPTIRSDWSDISSPGAGSIMVDMTLGLATVSVLLSAKTISRHLNAAPADAVEHERLAPLADGLAKQEVDLKVWLGEVELTVAILQSISVGDVIRLPARLDDPLPVTTSDGEVAFKSYLGLHDGHKAVELARN